MGKQNGRLLIIDDNASVLNSLELFLKHHFEIILTLKNPNRARSLISSFCNGNPSQFHAADGSGYAFWTEQVIALNKLNPQVAARLVRTLDHWKKYQPALKIQMQAALQKVAATKGLSKDVQEVVFKTLG